MPRHPPRKSLLNTTTTTTTNTTTTTTSSSPRPGTTQATRKGDAEIPSELDLFFLELDALFNAHQDRQQIDSLHAQILANMRDELARDATARRHSSVRQTSSPQQSDAVSTTESTTYTTVAEMVRLTETDAAEAMLQNTLQVVENLNCATLGSRVALADVLGFNGPDVVQKSTRGKEGSGAGDSGSQRGTSLDATASFDPMRQI